MEKDRIEKDRDNNNAIIENKKNFIINVSYVVVIVLIAYFFFKNVFPLISPFVYALVIAYFLRKPARKLSKSLKIPNKVVSLVLVLLFYSIIGLAIALVSIKIASVIQDLFKILPEFYTKQISPVLFKAYEFIEDAVMRIDPSFVDVINENYTKLVSMMGEQVSKLSITLVGSISNAVTIIPSLFIKVLLMIISTFFIALDFDELSEFTHRQLNDRAKEILGEVKNYMVNTLFVVIKSYLLIMTITFVELAIGLSIIKVENAIIIAFAIAVFDILPVVGTGGIMIPWGIYTLIKGNVSLGIGLLAIYLIITVIRNIIEPKIVGSQLGLHPVVTLMSMFVGLSVAGGLLGLFGFPILLSLLKHLNGKGLIKIFK